MVQSVFEAYLVAMQIIIFAILVSIMINHRRKYGVLPLKWLILSFSFGLIEALYDLIAYLVIKFVDEDFSRYERMNLIPFGLGIMMIYLFAESIYGERPNSFRIGIIMFLLGMSYSLLFYTLTLDDAVEIERLRVIYDTIFDAFQIASMGFVVFVYYISMMNAHNKHFIKITRYLVLTTGFYVIAAIVDFFKDLMGYSSILVVISYTISLFILALIYLKYPFYVFIVPAPIYSLIISSKNGVIIYKADLFSHEYKGHDELFVSAITALNKLFNTLFDATELVETITFQSRSTIIAQKNELIAILLTKRKTKVLKSTLDQFLNDLEKTFPELSLKDHLVYKLEEDKILDLIIKTMPFLDSKEVVSNLINQ